MICKACKEEKNENEFYANDKTCKVCRRAMVKANREKNADYYRQYDKDRFKNDPRVKERHKRYAQTERGKNSAAKAKRKYIEQNPIKRGAHIITGNAIRDGILIKKPCEICGCTTVHAHHDDYAYPLSVRWLCAKHHKEWHSEHGEGANAI